MTDETRTPAPDDEKLGELLRRHAALYNEPPATPREALWARTIA